MSEMQKQSDSTTPKKIVIISLLIFIVLMAGILALYTYKTLKNDNIYSGVYINSINVGNLSQNDAFSLVEKSYKNKLEDAKLEIKCSSYTQTIEYSNLGVTYLTADAVKEAYNVGRTGNIFQRMYDILQAGRKNRTIDMKASFDNKKIEDAIDYFYNKTYLGVKESTLLISKDKVAILAGHNGVKIDKQKAFSQIETSINLCDGQLVEIPVIRTEPAKINADEYLNKINQQAVDASYKIIDNQISITPHSIGMSIEKSALTSAIETLGENEDEEVILPVTFVQPKMTKELLDKNLFRDVLSEYKTQFFLRDEIEKNRASNIKLISSKINGKLLAPGEEFSYNKTAGKRTPEAGYLPAYTFDKDGKVTADTAGGICQVSSTLYNAVLQADLKVTERVNHMYVVSYADPGMDATIYGDAVDLKFKNSTNWPIKIEVEITKDNRVHFTLRGTNEHPERTVKYYSKIVKEYNFEKIYIIDPTIGKNESKVTHAGGKGFTVETYKVVTVNGKTESDKKIYTSYYKALNEEIHIGTSVVPPPGSKIIKSDGTPIIPKQTAKPQSKPAIAPSTKPSQSPTVTGTPKPYILPTIKPTPTPSSAPFDTEESSIQN